MYSGVCTAGGAVALRGGAGRAGAGCSGGLGLGSATRPDLLTALRAIPPRLAAAIVLRYYHGYNNREIAAALGVSERTIGTRLNQAAARLRPLLEESRPSAFSLGAGAALSSEQDASSNAEH